MPKMTIYVGDALKADMDRMGDVMNWSALAQEAFQAAIKREEWKMESDRIAAAKARLKASKERIEADDAENGKQAGIKWAMESAEYDELVKVAELDDGSDAHSVCEELEQDGFWTDIVGRFGEQPSAAFVSGFISGVAEFRAEHLD